MVGWVCPTNPREASGLDPEAVHHGTSQAIVGCGDYDYVLHGHTHQRVHRTEGGTVRINPGGVATGPGDDEPPGAVVLDTDTGDVTFHDLR